MRTALVAAFALHLVLGGWLGLSVDEAHYALYAAHPALSYFDHPPLVGWVQWPLVALDAPEFVLRLVPGMLWLATVVLVWHIALRLGTPTPASLGAQDTGPGFAPRAATAAVLALLLAPLMHVLGIGLVPDTLLMVLHAALMLQTLRMAQMPLRLASAYFSGGPLREWLLLGVLLGLAGLSKYTAIFSAVAVAACLLRAHGWRLLRAPGLWLSTLLALVVVSPVAIWNAQNDWISLAYQARHGAGGEWQLLHVLRFVLVQLLAYGPLLWWGWRGWVGLGPSGSTHPGAQPGSPVRWALWFFAFPFGMLAYLSGGGSSLPHWTAPAWVALAPFAGWGLAWAWQAKQGRVLQALAAVQGLACVLLLATMVSGGMPMMAGKVASAQSSDPPNPFADLHGWDGAGAQALQLARQQGLHSVSVQNWTLASRLGWYARPLPVHALEDRFDQFDLWAGDLPVGADTLLVDWSQMSYQLPVGVRGFASCTQVGTHAVQRLGYALARFDFYACKGWGGVPQPKLR